jgi:hypothetical protein
MDKARWFEGVGVLAVASWGSLPPPEGPHPINLGCAASCGEDCMRRVEPAWPGACVHSGRHASGSLGSQRLSLADTPSRIGVSHPLQTGTMSPDKAAATRRATARAYAQLDRIPRGQKDERKRSCGLTSRLSLFWSWPTGCGARAAGDAERGGMVEQLRFAAVARGV